jgi:ATP-dependent Lon protease
VADDAAFHDRWAAYLPGWEMPRLAGEMLTDHVGFILDYTAEFFHRELRRIGHYGSLWEKWFEPPANQWSARDLRSVNRTFSGLTKLIFPSGEMAKEDARLLLELALELRLRVRLQLHAMNAQEFPLTEFTYTDRQTGVLKRLAVEA